MKQVLGIAALAMLAACGQSEDDIRADERTQMLEERIAELEAEKDSAAADKTASDEDAGDVDTEKETADERQEPVSAPRDDSIVQNSTGPSTTLIASYNAFIGREDLYNSDGKRLTAPWQVLRQDRANYHRYSVSQSGDQSDPFFSSANNRAIMERMVANGTIGRSAGRRVVNGNVSVRVDIYGNGSSGQSVNITVR